MTTTTRRLLAALAIAGSLALPAGAASAAPAEAPDPSDGVRVSVEIGERETPAPPSVVVVGPVVVGGELVVRGSGLAPRTSYAVWLESDPVLLGTVTTDAAGAFELVTTVPLGTVPGEHHVRVVVPGGTDVVSAPFLVLAAPGEPQEPGTDPTAGTSDGGATGGGTTASPRPGGLATTGTGLVAAAVLAGLAVAAGAVLRRRAGRAGAAS